LALKSELYRQELIRAQKDGSQEVLDFYKNEYGVPYSDRLKEVDTHIVPVNITYYPIRPGKNIITKIAQKFLKKLPPVIAEELEIEGNILLSSNINISFGKAIRIADYSRRSRSLVNQIPLIKNKTKSNLVIQYLKYRLTAKFMGDIYLDTKINLDHLFTTVLLKHKGNRISVDHLKRIIYSAAVDIENCHKYRLSYSVKEANLVKIFNHEPHKEFDSIVKLAKSLNIIKESADGKFYTIDKVRVDKKHGFHDIRKDNTLQVIFNEFSLLSTANLAVKRSMKMEKEKLYKEVSRKIFKHDVDNFEEDYKKYYDANFSKQKEIGAPFFLENNGEFKDVGIILCHGYQSAPEEVRDMGLHLNSLGFRVYGTRLKGHGTAPDNIKDISYLDWYDSVQRGYATLSVRCSKIIFIGFSTGGLLSLLSCARKSSDDVFAVVCINAALQLQDVRARFVVPGITIWNDMLSKFNISKAKMEYVENNSENPGVNYSRNYLSGVRELGKLMDECSDNLEKVHNPALIIYSRNDPIVKPNSSIVIEKEIKSKIKELVEFDLDNHIIVFGENNHKVFDAIEKFIFKLLKK
jgi:esterase/lipase